MVAVPLTAAKFAQIGEALYGPSWRAALAKALNVAERTVRRWEHSEATIPDGLRSDLATLCRKHSTKLAKLADELE